MSEMKTVRTSELIGAALDWAVAKAQGVEIDLPGSDVVWAKYAGAYSPSTDWSQGGPLLDEIGVAINPKGIGQDYVLAVIWHNRSRFVQSGPTTLVASARAIVESRIGHEIKIPAELLP